MMQKKIINMILFSSLSCLLVLCFLCSGSRSLAQTQTPAYDNNRNGVQQSSPTPRTDSKQRPNASQAPRQDYYYGTFHEGIVMETDPQTGTRIIQVTPPPEKEKNSNSDNTYVISPEIKISPK